MTFVLLVLGEELSAASTLINQLNTMIQYVMGLTTSSSSAALTTNLRTTRESFGVDNRIANFGVPILRGIEIVENAKSQMNGQAKCFRYAMSHPAGKIEILGVADDGKTLFKYHQAKDPENAGRLFARRLEPDQCWL